MLSLRLSTDADEDRLGIWVHIAAHSERAADRMIERLDKATARLCEFPYLGPARDEIRPGLRMWPVSDYLIFHRVDPDALSIIRILHGARDIPAILSP